MKHTYHSSSAGVLLLLLFCGIVIPTICFGNAIRILSSMEDTPMLHWSDLLINIATGVISATATTIVVYFKFLKHIPEQTEQKINQLLNSRLSYETTNHNAEMNALNPSNAHLSKEHDRILSTVHSVNEKLVSQEARAQSGYELMRDNQREVVKSIRHLDAIPTLWQDLLIENQQLRQRNFELTEALQAYQQPRTRQNDAWDLER